MNNVDNIIREIAFGDAKKIDDAAKKIIREALKVMESEQLNTMQFVAATIVAAGIITGTGIADNTNADCELKIIEGHTRLFVNAITQNMNTKGVYIVGSSMA